ncbi:UNVERIFIED_ORG: pyruvate/2-oxoglutarate/acetoin dehydrogenase E1 component [Arthrobacter sp. UYEF13]
MIPRSTGYETSLGARRQIQMVDPGRADPSVLVFGEDVGRLGGDFHITDGLTAEFGEHAGDSAAALAFAPGAAHGA